METYPGTYNKPAAELNEAGKPALDMTYFYEKRGTNKQSVHSPESFAQWYTDVPGVNISMPLKITLDNGLGPDVSGGVYVFAREKQLPAPYNYFFPIDNHGYGLTYPMEGHPLRWEDGGVHNFHFTYELRTTFTYTDLATRDLNGNGVAGETGDQMVFRFVGDDDVFVYVNGKLVVDLGGVHSQKEKTTNIDSKADELGLVPGENYELALFFAERHTSESNFRIETTLQLEEITPTTISPLYD